MFKRLVSARSRALALACAATMGSFSFVSPASAATVTKTIQFEASDFFVFIAGQKQSVALPNVTGRVTLTLDPDATVSNQTAGITLDSLSIPLGSAISFESHPLPSAYAPGIGGIDNGPLGLGGSNADFYLALLVSTISDSVLAGSFAYTPGAFGPSYGAGHLDAYFVTVPEPSTWTLMIGGIALLGGALRVARRRAAAIA